MVQLICEACERAAVELVEPCDDSDEPYHLCGECHRRLHARALRPLEWYNLAKRHGWYQYLLHDDFYDDDGTATAPEEEVEVPERFPAPVLDAVAHSPDTLLDYTITRWHLDDELVGAWMALAPQGVLETLAARYAATRNAGIRGTVLEVCAAAGGSTAADLVRQAWLDHGDTAPLSSLAMASAACLPFREGFDRVRAVVDAREGGEQRRAMYVLGYFHAPEVLEWVEAHVFSPVTEEWGRLAADSKIDWPTVERWLGAGRPLSLVALDALAAIVSSREGRQRVVRPPLRQPPEVSRIVEALSAYAQRDPAPRVERITGYLLEHAAVLAGG